MILVLEVWVLAEKVLVSRRRMKFFFGFNVVYHPGNEAGRGWVKWSATQRA